MSTEVHARVDDAWPAFAATLPSIRENDLHDRFYEWLRAAIGNDADYQDYLEVGHDLSIKEFVWTAWRKAQTSQGDTQHCDHHYPPELTTTAEYPRLRFCALCGLGEVWEGIRVGWRPYFLDGVQMSIAPMSPKEIREAAEADAEEDRILRQQMD